ncbi:MAG TPA: ester cyclase [Thermomicrobiales bacterium]|jgi:predicted ester cyclase|nr:ester cyclase [Thermomicrobiales bacterium]
MSSPIIPPADGSQERRNMNAQERTARNKEIVRRFVEEVVNRGRADLINDLVAADYVFHCPDGDLYGPLGARLNVEELWLAFPDLHMDLTDLVGEGNLVARRFVLRGVHLGPFLGLRPTEDDVSIPGIALDRLANGRIAESWIAFNTLGLVHAGMSVPT